MFHLFSHFSVYSVARNVLGTNMAAHSKFAYKIFIHQEQLTILKNLFGCFISPILRSQLLFF